METPRLPTAGLRGAVHAPLTFDVQYGIDNLNRVTRADEGTFASGSISNRSRDEQWTLTQTGNWDRAKVDLNGDGDFTDAGETDDTRTHNVANEMQTRDTDTNGTANYNLTHDAVGNMTDDGMAYKMVYDVWGRLRMIKNQSNNLVAEYRYNGLNQRLSWHYDTDADGDCDSNDKTYYFAYDDQWRVVATFRDSDTSPKERFLYHAAGLGGYGGAGGGIGGYIDHVIFRDKDANTAWDTASDGTLEERIYYCQNWRADVSAILTSSGKLVEWIKYSAYGTPTALPTGDTDSDGDFDLTDLGNMGGGYEIRKDAELDGDVDANDINYAIANGYQTLGRGVLSSSYVANRKGYAAYENDGAIVRFAHVRHRVLDSTLGRWTRRDPIGYADGSSLYEYTLSQPLISLDPMGLTVGWCERSRIYTSWNPEGASGSCGDDGMWPPDFDDPIERRVRHLRLGNPPAAPRPAVNVVGSGCGPCLATVMADPEVQAAVAAANRACPPGAIRIKCDSGPGCQQQATQSGWSCTDSTITICMPSGCRSGDILFIKVQLLHELTHGRQICEQGCAFYTTCRLAVCAEIEAYCNENVSPCGPQQICTQACGSATPPCGAGCMALCQAIFWSCTDDGDPSTLLPMQPILLPNEPGNPYPIAADHRK